MTQFEQLEMIYKQFSNLANEIESMVENDEYNEAISKLQYKDSLIKKFLLIKKTMDVSGDEKEEIIELEKKLVAREQENIQKLIRLRDEVSRELKKTHKSVKVNNAYTIMADKHGSILDFSE